MNLRRIFTSCRTLTYSAVMRNVAIGIGNLHNTCSDTSVNVDLRQFSKMNWWVSHSCFNILASSGAECLVMFVMLFILHRVSNPGL